MIYDGMVGTRHTHGISRIAVTMFKTHVTTDVIGTDIDADNEQLRFTGGYDHNFCINGWDGKLREIAVAEGDISGIKMHVYTTLPGVQFYAGNFLKGIAGKGSKPMEKRSGFCLETQFYPDTPHNAAFPLCFYKAGEKYVSETVYEFSAK